jgi:hypothetical protein
MTTVTHRLGDGMARERHEAFNSIAAGNKKKLKFNAPINASQTINTVIYEMIDTTRSDVGS